MRPGDRVATLLPDGAAPAVLAHAVPRLGATLVPLNVRLSAPELAWQLGDATPGVLVAGARTAALAEEAARDAPHVRVLAWDRLDYAAPAPGVPLRLAHDPDAVLAILYTSGTTGRPKGAMLTVGNFWWSAVGSALNLGARADDRWLACLPLFHVGGLSIVLRAAVFGFAALVHDGFDAAAVNRAIDDDGVTIVSVVAVMLERMLDARRDAAGRDRPYPPSLRCVLLGGGPAPRPLLERCAALGVPVVQTYGLTETCSQVATLAPEDALPRLGAAGRALYPNALRVVDDDGRDAAPGAAGAILVRGPVVTAGYWARPDATARAIVDGWLHTGDVGRLDADGYLYVLDRRDDLVVTGGENVYPAEVEAALLADARVAEAAVVGVPDATWGQRVVAVVRLADDAPNAAGEDVAAALRAGCRARLAGYKVPREVRVVATPLPRTAAGKLRRAAVREALRAPPGSDATP
ncbi:2-succinylbenzoate--CoA ligase [Gemmatimonadetes bacterium T265]|nr:2-succinylbenzoate--CoA ligase [Gemmatimonadetes bacterium T265]